MYVALIVGSVLIGGRNVLVVMRLGGRFIRRSILVLMFAQFTNALGIKASRIVANVRICHVKIGFR